MEGGRLSIKHAYDMVTKTSGSTKYSDFPWDQDSAPAHSMMVWKLMHNRVSTDENLFIRCFSFPSIRSLCQNAAETTPNLFFTYDFTRKIWLWFYKSWSLQALIVIRASTVFTFYQIWQERNNRRFHESVTHWKHRISNIAARDKMVGTLTSKKSHSYVSSFSILKAFDIDIHQRNPLTTVEFIWCPPNRGWIKCNIDGVASGNPYLATCGGLFRDDKVTHLTSFGVFLGNGSSVFAEFMAAILAIEKAKEMN
ncbi:uncharacterized protein LOC131637016 [Vicia villosa]|uniref:uncharacterized protein LOC131637016 n=1 Tax=Vicia villosa TaxID=3911 RepID=UPI00273B31F2|nr:uncharacterized protein LOC131637016 [Vicia villosa]